MRFLAASLGLLLLPSILIAQEAPEPPDVPRFLFFLPDRSGLLRFPAV